MIASLCGILRSKSPTEVLLDVNGVGYAVSIPLSTFAQLGEVNSTVLLLTHLQIRDDAVQLFGFATEEERFLFKLLLSVNGIGPKIAQGILSGIGVKELRSHIASGNVGALTGIPGVGRKTAERIVVELRDKMARMGVPETTAGPLAEGDALRSDAILALTTLGYTRAAAEKAIQQVWSESNAQPLTLEDLIKRSLKFISGI
jgi:Holliday junction DNA helicase RuvA